jgi:hypothetical protein
MKENFEFTNSQAPEKDTDNDNQSEEQKRESRYVCYVDERKTSRVTELPTEGMIANSMREIMRDKIIPPKEELEKAGYKENPEFIKNVELLKKEIADFAKELGVDVANLFPPDENIYELDEELVKKIFPHIPNIEKLGGYSTKNDIFSKKGSAEASDTLRHELIHSVTRAKYLLRATSETSFEEKELAFGFAIGEYLANFNEGLTELTNLQISLKHEGSCSSLIGYINNVIFISELAEDMANKINSNPDMIKDFTALHSGLQTPLTQKDLLAHLQIGMLNGDPRYLKIISDIYDDESKKFNALKTLAGMGKYKDEVLETAKAFGLEEVMAKINDYSDKKEIDINIGGFHINL